MAQKKRNAVVYIADQLPIYLKPLAESKGFIYEDDLKKNVSAQGVQLYVIDLMRANEDKFTALMGYRFGVAKGFASLMSITTQYLSNQDKAMNVSFIKEMHFAAKPFFPDLLLATGDDFEAMAIELQRAHDFAYKSIMKEVQAQ